MSKEQLANEDKKGKVSRPEQENEYREREADAGDARASLADLQNQIGNRAMQRLLAQRSQEGPAQLDDETAGRINRARSGGQSLDHAVQKQMGAAMGQDFSGVRVHTSPESHALNEQLGAKAFTTGQDIFFREGAYIPHSSGGQELIAHELTHVVQQGSGQVKGGPGMTVNAPGDSYELEADAVAKQVTGPAAGSGGGESGVQRQLAEEEEELQTKAAQRQEVPEEEEEAQMQPEEEEEVQAKAVQRQEEMPEEEEELQTKAMQRQEVPEEEELA